MERTDRSAASGEAGKERPQETASLRVLDGGRVVFSSWGRWLYPLFDLEEFLEQSSLSPARLHVEDKIIGRAAAFLIVRMGLHSVHGSTMSRLATGVLRAHSVAYSYATLVNRIECRTEGLLEGVDEVETAYSLVRERAGR